MKTGSAKILLAAVFIARGTSFLFSKSLMLEMTPLSVLAVRFTMAFLILAIVFNKKIRECNKASLIGGIELGLIYTVCMVLEMYGLRTIDTGVAAVIENMAIILVPIYVAIWTRVLPKSKTIICAVIAVIGVACLSLTQSTGTQFNYGVLLAILAALTYGGCILVTDSVARKGDPLTIGIVQMGTMGVISFILALCTGTFEMPHTGNNWAMILMLVLVCSCFGFTFQPVAQKYLPAETAAMFSVMNPLASSIMGFTIAHESHGALKIIGCILILVDLIYYNLNTSRGE